MAPTSKASQGRKTDPDYAEETLTAYTKFETEHEKLERRHGKRGEENQDPESGHPSILVILGGIMVEYSLPTGTSHDVDLVGEFYRRDRILKIIGGAPTDDEPKRASLLVALVPEPDNPHSPRGDAISARVGGFVIGYLSSSDARKWSPVIHRITASGATAVTQGNVFAYKREKWAGNGSYKTEVELNVRVGLPEPEMILPLNTESLSTVAVLPWGSALQVTKEEDHFDHLFEYVPEGGEGMVVLTMHLHENVLKNGTVKELVEVRLDGERVGQLTPTTSQHYLATVRHAKDMEKELGVWAKLKGSGVAAELVIQGARAVDLPDQWLREMPTLPVFTAEADSYEIPGAYIADEKKSSKTKTKTQQKPRTASTNNFGGNETLYQVGKKQVTISDKQRQHAPGVYRGAGVAFIVIAVIIGLALAAIPGVGPILSIGAIVLGVMGNLGQRRIAKALEIERGSRLPE
ncbi:hypothetical protein GCM10010525_06280 [Glutamicibacter bergerei]|nr:hypothetical protein [Micrococcaceae bacterium]